MDYKPAIASMSLGRAWVHELQPKLDQASKQAFQGIEIFYEDLEYLAKSLPGGLTDSNILSAAKLIKTLCIERNLEIIGLQPFMHYEGLLDPVEHANRIKKLHLWFQIVKILGTNIIQIPTNFLTEGITGDHEILVRDLREVADLGLKEVPPVRFAYENLCWGTFIDTWKGAWSLVTAVDRKNFGMCLDTFNIAGREWADPAAPSGTIPNADAVLDASLEEMVRTVDINKVFYVQVVDAERLSSPLGPGHEFYVESQPARMSWSRNARLFPFEDGAYLPVLKVLRAITEGLGYKGWISMELFSRTMADPRPECPSEHAERGIKAFRRLVQEMGWEAGTVST